MSHPVGTKKMLRQSISYLLHYFSLVDQQSNMAIPSMTTGQIHIVLKYPFLSNWVSYNLVAYE